jgi:hypothetical protein
MKNTLLLLVGVATAAATEPDHRVYEEILEDRYQLTLVQDSENSDISKYPEPGSQVFVHYEARVKDHDQVFDSSY